MIGARIAKGLWLLSEGSGPTDEATGIALILEAAEEGDYAAHFLLYGLSAVGDARLPVDSRDKEFFWAKVNARLEQEDATKSLCGMEQKLRNDWMFGALFSREEMDRILYDLYARLDCEVT